MVYLNVIQCNLCETGLCLSPYEVNNLLCNKCWIIVCYLKPKRLRRKTSYSFKKKRLGCRRSKLYSNSL